MKAGFQVIGVEPNREMREAAERLLAVYPAFTSINGSAQETTLTDQSVDLIVAGQAFHWFDTPETRAEFNRILKPGGHIVLMWNERELDTTPFLRDYEQLLLKFGTDYSEIRHENVSDTLGHFFIGDYATHFYHNEQRYDFGALKGRLLSSSYTPNSEHPDHEPMLAELRRIYDLHQIDGIVGFEYTTKVFIGR